ncbi:hypothetical protein NWI01_34630 [Nitrobacter winogradskyi]|uniref:Uncharacterized protein n=1 Tax=Nitrobacter winogradskyi TaxID=913 RepID=A0A4Y3WHA2_NITWI|nr:hypothetical protein NWI01_34630 [Nitrobacter winogradskyi]
MKWFNEKRKGTKPNLVQATDAIDVTALYVWTAWATEAQKPKTDFSVEYRSR